MTNGWARTSRVRRHRKLLLRSLALLAAATILAAADLPTAPGRPVQSNLEPSRGMVLVAHEDLRDPNFARTVVLLVDHGDEGAFGLIVNRPTDFRLSEALPGLEGLSGPRDAIYIGGPVARDQMVFLIRPNAPSAQTVHVMDDVFFTGDLEAVVAAADREGADFRAYSGYSGWAPGQLEAEIARGDWLVLPGDPEDIFDSDPLRLWGRLMRGTSLKSVRRNAAPNWISQRGKTWSRREQTS